MLAEAIVSAYVWLRKSVAALSRKRTRFGNTAGSAPSDPRKRPRVSAPPRPSQNDAGPSRRPPPPVRRPLVSRRASFRPVRPRPNLQQLATSSLSRSLPSVDDYVRSYVTPTRPTKRALARAATEGLILHLPSSSENQPQDGTAVNEEPLELRDPLRDPLRSLKRPAETSISAEKRQRLEAVDNWEGTLMEAEMELNDQPIVDANFESIPSTASHQLPYGVSVMDSPSFELPQLPDDIHDHFQPIDDGFSAMTLHVLEDYLNADLKAQIRSKFLEEEEASKGHPAFHPGMLTAEDRQRYASIAEQDDHHVFFTLDNCDFVLNDVRRLLPDQWLNDNLVNGYMKLLQLRDQKAVASLSCHFCKTFLMNHIYPNYSYGHVRKWTMEKRLKNWGQRQPSILQCDLVFFPVNQSNMHWVLVVADLRKNIIRYYDSMGPSAFEAETIGSKVAQYLRDEAKDKLGTDEGFNNFRFECGTIPLQTNSSDCGVFVARAAKELGGNHHLNFDAEEMNDYRVLIFKELSSGHVL